MTDAASIANDRFGLGARPDTRVPDDVRGWLAAQLRRFDPASEFLAQSLPTRELITAYAVLREQAQDLRRGDSMLSAEDVTQQRRMNTRRDIANLYDGMSARLTLAANSDAPFAERLVHFWSNHFAISSEQLRVKSMAADMEFSAIRPNVMGNFSDLLRAAVGHPAMLQFLDQITSIGPRSNLASRVNRRGGRRQLGLNENLAREVLELHTLGVRSGYSQEDVIELARALTGWTVAGFATRGLWRFVDGEPGETVFIEGMHEPGARVLLGRSYPADGAEQALAMLGDLARHPATARHIAVKLARHFIADQPPESAISRLESAFLASGGELSAVYEALIGAPEVWQAERVKFRTPWDWSVAALRATGTDSIPGNSRSVHTLLDTLGQPIWRPGSPAGWGDVASDWASPGALLSRVEVANRLALRNRRTFDPRNQPSQVLGSALRPSTAQAIARAEEPTMGLALLLSSPEFMRR